VSVLSRLLRRPDDDAVLVIEPMRKKDLSAIMAIERVSYPKPWTTGVFQSEIELSRQGERHYIVARRDQRLVGYAGAMFVVGDAHVTNIAAAPEARRSGVATRLLAELAWEAIRASARRSRSRCGRATWERRRSTADSASPPSACGRSTTRTPRTRS
jgi:ribosomal protein S18 acetylase RimI-like enzyme